MQVVAPDRNRSGASNSLTLESSLRTFTYENGDIAVQMGTPTDCVFLGVNALMRPRPTWWSQASTLAQTWATT